MMVNITAAEYDAIQFCCEQVTSAVEGTSNEQYVTEANEAVSNIANLSRKYHDALAKKEKKAAALQAVKQIYPSLDSKAQKRLATIAAKSM